MKTIIYQLLPRLFGNRNLTNKPRGTIAENGCGKFDDITTEVIRRIKTLGATHIWLTGIIRHATTTDYSTYGLIPQHQSIVKGKAGSPYAIVDYYDVCPDLANNIEHRFDEFLALVSRIHKEGMKVVIDFVPNHVARQYHSICRPKGIENLTDENFYILEGETFAPKFDIGNYLENPAKATGNDCFNPHPSTNDWYDTIKLNYDNHSTWQRMAEIMHFWASTGIDALRCDMAEMVITDFWRWAIGGLKEKFPHITIIGEVYQPHRYREFLAAGFDLLYDKVGMYDCLRDVVCNRRSTKEITHQWQQTDDIQDSMLYFLENHDEQRIASDFFAGSAEKGLPAVCTALLLRRNPLLIYAGQEMGERGMDTEGFSGSDGRTTIFDYWALRSLNNCFFDRRRLTKSQKTIIDQYQKLLQIAISERAITDGDFFDLMYVNPQLCNKQYAFLRKTGKELLLIVVNFDSNELSSQVVIPQHAFDYLELRQATHRATDLITKKKESINLMPDTPIDIKIDSNSYKILKLKL